MKKLYHILLLILACTQANLTQTAAIETKTAEATANIIMRISKKTGLSSATNANILWTACLAGGFLTYRWYKNKQILDLKMKIKDLESAGLREKTVVLRILLKPIIQEQLRRDHASFDPRKTGPDVKQLFDDINAEFLRLDIAQTIPTPTTAVTHALAGTLIQPQYAEVVAAAATAAIDAAVGETTTARTLSSIKTLQDIKDKIKAITQEPEMKIKIERVYPDWAADSYKVTRGLRYLYSTVRDNTVGR